MGKNNDAFDFAAHEIKIDKLIENEFESKLLSNTKWRKCFSTLESVSPELQVIWKFVGSKNQGVRNTLPAAIALEERYLNSRFWFGPCYYKEIEWLEFPAIGKPYGKENIPGSFFPQSIHTVKDLLSTVGQWPFEETELGFRINGYVSK